MKIKLTIEYSGTEFSGWQLQPEQLTVQGELERAVAIYLSALARKDGQTFNDRILVTSSGRTDAGVHARGQVASFPWPENLPFDGYRLRGAINGIAHRAITVIDAVSVPDSFDARLSPHRKCYRYAILLREGETSYFRDRVWSVPQPLDIAAMIRAAHSFVGQHDFSSFRAKDCAAQSTVRTLLLSEFSRPSPELLLFHVVGCGFLKQMVRIMVGTLVDVGLKKIDPEELPSILAAGDRSRAGLTAPPQGLSLEWVRYLDH